MTRQSDAAERAILTLAATAAKTCALRLDRNLRKTTPVDTGHARASWIPSVGSPTSDVPEGADQAMHGAGVLEVLSYRRPDKPIYESTNVPYMRRLNGGSSSQAPVAFIEVAIAEAEAYTNAKFAGKIVLDVTSAAAAEGAGNLADAYSPFGEDE